jgi:hypothetical protein
LPVGDGCTDSYAAGVSFRQGHGKSRRKQDHSTILPEKSESEVWQVERRLGDEPGAMYNKREWRFGHSLAILRQQRFRSLFGPVVPRPASRPSRYAVASFQPFRYSRRRN